MTTAPNQTQQGSSAQRGQARRKSLASRFLFPATFTLAVVGVLAPMPLGAGQRPTAHAEATFAHDNPGDILFTPPGEPPRLGIASFLGHKRPLGLQRPPGNASVGAVPPSPAPPAATQPAGPTWPPGTTAETYKFTSLDKTVVDVQSLIDGKAYAARAFDVLDQLEIRDIVDALKLLDRDHGTVDALRRLPQAANFPRVAGAAAAVKDPEGFVLPGGIGETERNEMEAFRKVRQWPTLLPRQVVALDHTQDAITDFIRRERSTIKEHALDVVPKDDNNMGGYKYSGKPGLDPQPTNLQGSDARRTEVNQLVWRELGGEGSGASINTYDNQRAIVTWGRGFAARGQLGEAMSRLFATDPAVRNLLLDAGFALTGREWLAVDVSTGQVKTGDDALNLVRWDKKILSRLIRIGEDPAHAQKWIDAQAATILRNAGAVPEAAKGWPDGVIRFVAHCVHWGGLSWSSAVAAGGDLKTIVQEQSQHVPATESWRGGSRLVSTQPTATFLSLADGIARDVLGTAESAPTVDDQDKTTMQGHIFFDAGSNQFFHLAP